MRLEFAETECAEFGTVVKLGLKPTASYEWQTYQSVAFCSKGSKLIRVYEISSAAVFSTVIQTSQLIQIK